MHFLKSTTQIIALLLILFGLTKHLGPLVKWGTDIGFLITFLYQLYVPLFVIEREHKTLASYAIHAHGIFTRGKFNKASFYDDIGRTLLLTLISFPLYGLAFFWFRSYYFGQGGFELRFEPRLPADFFRILWTNFILIGLSEEIFYRGFLQTRLLKKWSPVKAILVTNLVFALAHFVGDYQIGRLLPFFPGLLFSWLTYRSGSIMGAVVYHALCNIFSQVLAASMILR